MEQCQADEQQDQLFQLFNEQRTSDSVVQYLRLLTSAHLQNQADFFCNFVEAPNLQAYCRQVSNKFVLPSSDKKTQTFLSINWEMNNTLYCYLNQEVETMAMECDHVDILALSQALGICIHIVSMEGDEQLLAHHVIPEGAEPSVHLLYQTSHYNILYPRAQDWSEFKKHLGELTDFGWLKSRLDCNIPFKRDFYKILQCTAIYINLQLHLYWWSYKTQFLLCVTYSASSFYSASSAVAEPLLLSSASTLC